MRFVLHVFLVVPIFATAQSISPEVITTGGGYFENNYSSVSITIGEPISETISNGNVVITQGFQQVDYNITSIEDINTISLSMSIFPNPTTDLLTIKVEDFVSQKIQYALFDISGKQLLNSEILCLCQVFSPDNHNNIKND
ncbi:MAG TPA: hypothetical protein DDX39_07175 [Bacteroidales bacterium]|nr:MAG: hypothetical protein A2W98_01995 [Bacteroidetes bacterium GWF2_33_38]OFY68681.1 MAG: hypothetical protein A2265_01745 [Bacteroidetes bacterium RIFOXYA12_FULL_33_9]OFY85230.1 MAG: hypothetical protein A2236_10320 [Bacteroidetes bacterium RIFOXYA2_FULL_33_7]HBF88411.1 hypothetical protein [Bacteroidales bacterium]